ncbi:MAG: transglutaminase domain-containing protein, partial [Bacteroidaceae bacterium]|nr:transglutaminase domain-containing protein [Bacteroidaceae bacterium]
SSDLFPEDDGAKALSGMPAEKLWALLPGADSTFATTATAYGEMTTSMYNEIKEFADALIAKEKNPSVARIHRVLFDWIVKNVKYADGYCSNEPYDVFTTKKAVCQGYANLLSVMARTQGLHIITVNGYMNHNNSFFGHAWNYVQLNNGDWWVSDPTNNILVKGEKLEEYKNQFLPTDVVGNIYENELIAVNFAKESLNLNEVKLAEESFVVPFSVTLNDGKKHQITSFSPKVDLPETIKEIYLGSNIQSLGGDGTYGLRDHAPYVEAAYVDPNNKFLESHNGIVYMRDNNEPVYIPTAMKSVTLKFTETIGKNYLYNHQGVEEFHVPAGTKKLEDWAVEKCPNLKVAYIPVDTEVSEKAFVDCHPDFQIIRQDQTGIKDVIAD